MTKRFSTIFSVLVSVLSFQLPSQAVATTVSSALTDEMSGLCVNITMPGTPGNFVTQWTCNQTPNQIFTFTPIASPSGVQLFTIQTGYGALCLSESTNGENLFVSQQKCTGAAAQQWQATKNSDGSYNILTHDRARCMDLYTSYPIKGSSIYTPACDSLNRQSFRATVALPIAVSGSNPAPSPSVKPSPSPSPKPTSTPTPTPTPTLSAGPGTTWYIRKDGGTAAECTGKVNAAYSGSGVNQPCALNHPFYLVTNNTDQSAFKWKIAGGDTVQFADVGPYYMGEQMNGMGQDWLACHGDIYDCGLPASIPAGTAARPTRILGYHAGSCHNADHTNLANPTQFIGINSEFSVVNLQNADYLDMECIDITQPDTCTFAGPTNGHCVPGVSNYARMGVVIEYIQGQGPTNTTIRDIGIHGLSDRGLLGSHINKTSSDVFTASDIYVRGNGMAGWDSDGGGCDTSCESVGTMNLSYVTVEWNGCNEVKPNGGTPGGKGYTYCNDEYSPGAGGYGDGFAFIAANVTLNVDHGTFRWNTQDGFDSLHLSDDLKATPHVTISDSLSEGNMGETFKLGGATSAAYNNVSIADCERLDAPFPGNPTGYNTNLTDFCRAGGDQWAFQMNNGQTLTLENNTSLGYGAVMYDFDCAYGATCTTGVKIIFENNVNIGFPDPQKGNALPSGLYPNMGGVDPFNNVGSSVNHNAWYSMKYNNLCPQDPKETNAVCGDPQLAGETDITNVNAHVGAKSPLIKAGIAIPGITTDAAGVARPNPPTIGAYEP